MHEKETEELLYDYFIQNASLSLPGIGTFDIYRISAQTDFANKKILPPYYTISYDRINDAPNKELFDYVSRKANIPEWQAIKLVNDFAQDLKSVIRGGGNIEWEGIGRLSAGRGGDIQFQPMKIDYDFIPDVGAQRVVRKGPHQVIVGDQERTSDEMSELLSDEVPEVKAQVNWWVFAAILAAAAGLLIAIRFFSGDLPSEKGRPQKIKPASTPDYSKNLSVLFLP